MKNSCITIIAVFILSLPISCVLAQSPKAPGKLVNAGGHLLHIVEKGKGSPVVVMESGSGDFSFVWSLVQPEVSRFTQTVSYDRAGFAWSEPGPNPRSDRQISFELHEALHHAGIAGPYILVGQSFGGFLVRAFARYYPKEVAGMVLVEALNENARIMINNKPTRIREFATGRKAPDPQTTVMNNRNLSAAATVEPAIIDTNIEPPLNKLPDSVTKMQLWAQSQKSFHIAVDSEMTWSPEDVSRLYLNRGRKEYMLGDMPLIVLTRGSGGYEGRPDSAELETERMTQQKELAELSTNSKHIIDKNSGHNIHLEDPALVIASIKEVFEAAKKHTNLKWNK